MMKGPARKPLELDEEIRGLESALRLLDVAVARLQEADEMVEEMLGGSGERVIRPNPRRAEQQIRTAFNAAEGARTALKRRIALLGGGLEPARRRTGPAKQK